MASSPALDRVTLVRRAGWLALLGFALVGASVATIVIGSWGANRPHEVRGEWLFHLLLVVQPLLGVLVLGTLVAAWRARERAGLRALHAVPIILALGYVGIVLAYLSLLGRALLD